MLSRHREFRRRIEKLEKRAEERTQTITALEDQIANVGNPDPEAFHQEILDAWKRTQGDYPKEQQYRDFRAVFIVGGATELQAKRVLWQIFNWGFMYRPMPRDAEGIQRAEGSRHLCLNIQTVLNAEPDTINRPTESIRDPEDI